MVGYPGGCRIHGPAVHTSSLNEAGWIEIRPDLQCDFGHGITFTEDAGARLAWNYEKAFSANMNTALSMPVFKNLGVNVTSFDSFVNNPPPGFKENTFQIAFGIRYAFK